jgi:UDP-glucose 4-epimerase
MKQRVLITGASGFVGYHLITAALAAGLEVHAAIRLSSNVDHLEPLNLKYVVPDFEDIDSLKALLEHYQYDYIIHAAGQTRARSEFEMNRVNTFYTGNLALAAQEANIPLKKFVFISSLAAIGPIGYNEEWPEVKEPAPVTSYGKSKLLAEQFLPATSLPWVVLRPTAVYGPREKDLFVLFKTFKRGWEPYIGRFSQRLSFVYVVDLARVAVQALTAPGTAVSYNISDGRQYDRYALAEIVKKMLQVRTFRFHLPLGLIRLVAGLLEYTSSGVPLLNREKLRELTAPSWNCSIQRLQHDLGFQPAYDLETGMQETIRWYISNKWI